MGVGVRKVCPLISDICPPTASFPMLFLAQAHIVEDAVDSFQFCCQQTVIQTEHTHTRD